MRVRSRTLVAHDGSNEVHKGARLAPRRGDTARTASNLPAKPHRCRRTRQPRAARSRDRYSTLPLRPPSRLSPLTYLRPLSEPPEVSDFVPCGSKLFQEAG